MSNYAVRWYTPSGNLLDEFSGFKKLEYVRAENQMGALTLAMPFKKWSYEAFVKCQMLEVWREQGNSVRLQNETAYFLQDWELVSAGGQRLIILKAYDANWLLKTRIVAEDAGEAQAEMTDYADDMMKAIVEDQLGATAAAGRDLSDYVSIAGDLSASESITKAFSRQNVLSVCQSIAQTATEAGTYTYFDMVRTGIGAFEFRTYTGQRGRDHGRDSGDVRLVGEQYGSLEDVSLSTTRSDEVNYVYAGGQGVGVARDVQTASDTTRINTGYPWNRVEAFADARNTDVSAAVTAAANARLDEGKPKQILTGKLKDTQGMQYDNHYGFGDVVIAEAFGYSVDCHVSKVKCKVEDGEEFNIKLKGEL